jgi:predicted  nucleic acid-binding Zn-ribbon protein
MEEQDVSGYVITDADRDFANALGFVAPEALPLHIARFRTKALKAAKARPEPTWTWAKARKVWEYLGTVVVGDQTLADADPDAEVRDLFEAVRFELTGVVPTAYTRPEQFGAPMAFQPKRTAQHNAESRALLAVGKRVFNRHTGARGTIVDWPESLPEDAYSAAILWDGSASDDVRILEIRSFGLLYCDEPPKPDARALTKAQPEPVPGAAVRALVGEFERLVEEERTAGKRAGSGGALAEFAARSWAFGESKRMVEAALRADRLASVELPRFHVTQAEWSDALSYDSDDRPWQLLKHLNTVLARRPATGVVRPAVCTPEQAREITGQICADLGVTYAPPDAAELVCAAINAELQPGTGEAEALRKQLVGLEIQRDQFRIEMERAGVEIRDLESQLASVTGELAELKQVDIGGALDSVDRLARELHGDFEVRRIAEREAAVLRDKLRDCQVCLKGADGDVEMFGRKLREAERERDEALAKLAARPEPVAMKELSDYLGEMANLHKRRGETMHAACYRHAAEMADACLSDARASVTVPQGEPHAPYCPTAIHEVYLEFKAALDAAGVPDDGGPHPDRVRALAKQRDQLRAELANTQALLQTCRQERFDRETEANKLRAELADRHKSLMATVEQRDTVLDEMTGLRAERDLSNRNAKEWEAREAAASDELEKTRAELNEAHSKWQEINNRHVTEKDACKEERDQLRTELEKTKAVLQTCREERFALETERNEARAELARVSGLREDAERACAKLEEQTAERQTDLRAELDEERDQLRATRAIGTKLAQDLELVRADLAACRVERDTWLGEHGRVSAELEACKRELFGAKAYGEQMCKARDRVQERHEALRDGVEYGCEALERHDGPENKVTTWYAEPFRALLKPAPAEAADEDDSQSFADWVAPEATPVQHPPPEQPKPTGGCECDKCLFGGNHAPNPAPHESAMVEQVQQPLDLPQRVQRLENVVCTFLHDWARASLNKARAAEVLEALDARKGSP